MQFTLAVLLLSETSALNLSRAELKHNSRAVSEIILPIACAVREFRQEIFGLNGANRKVLRDFIVKSSAHGHREGVQRRGVDTSRSPQQDLRKRRHLSMTAKINSRPSHVGEYSGMETIAGIVAAEVSNDPEPAVRIVSELTAASIEIVRVAEVADSHIVVSPVHLYSRSFILRSCRHGERGYRQQSCENADGRERR